MVVEGTTHDVETDPAGDAVTVVTVAATRVLGMVRATKASAMASAMVSLASLQGEVDGSLAVVKVTLRPASRAGLLMNQATLRVNTSLRSSVTILVTLTEVQILLISTAMEVINNTGLDPMGITTIVHLLDMVTMVIELISIITAMVEVGTMILWFKIVQTLLVLTLGYLRRLCRGLLRHWRQKHRDVGLKRLRQRVWVLWFQREHKLLILLYHNPRPQ
jgi:hypothetical protein